MKIRTKHTFSPQLLTEITQSLAAVDSHGSVEIFITDHQVTQITVRNIKKTHPLHLKANGLPVKKTLDKPISIY